MKELLQSNRVRTGIAVGLASFAFAGCGSKAPSEEQSLSKVYTEQNQPIFFSGAEGRAFDRAEARQKRHDKKVQVTAKRSLQEGLKDFLSTDGKKYYLGKRACQSARELKEFDYDTLSESASRKLQYDVDKELPRVASELYADLPGVQQVEKHMLTQSEADYVSFAESSQKQCPEESVSVAIPPRD